MLCQLNATERLDRAHDIELVCDTEQATQSSVEATNDVFLSLG